MKTEAKRARLLTQYTQKKLLNEEKQSLLEKLEDDHKKRKELLLKYKTQRKFMPPTYVSSRRSMNEALYHKALEDITNEENKKGNLVKIDEGIIVEKNGEVSSPSEDDWDGFLDDNPLSPSLSQTCTTEGRAEYIQDFIAGSTPLDGASLFRLFNRLPEIEESRSNLPILSEEQSIVEMIKYHDISFICGETGSGKTTQLPQFLLESGFAHPSSSLFPGKIIVTQPRRVAAMSMAARVAHELNEKDVVGYQVRYESSMSVDAAKVVFMTDGILLRIIANDFLLSAYSVILLDEAHERSINTDLLLGLLTRIVALRRKKFEQMSIPQSTPLKLVIMSATLRLNSPEEGFSNGPPQALPASSESFLPTAAFSIRSALFRGLKRQPPSIDIPSRQFPIHIHHSRRTPTDMLLAAYKKVFQIHKTLPPGGILLFVTGQDEVWSLVDRLRDHKSRKCDLHKAFLENADDLLSMDDRDDRCAEPDQHLNTDINESEEDDSEDITEDDHLDPKTLPPMRVLPFYSLLPYAEQEMVLTASRSLGESTERLVVVATNLAETSLTIPGISYVVDTGRVKQRVFNENGVESYLTSWISKASAQQRAGRAGRTGPGHVYRLYSASVFEDLFDDFDTPEILRMPAENMVLQMKAMNIDNVIHFPFPTPPDPVKLGQGERLLSLLGALSITTGTITEVGRGMALFPLPVRMSKMLVSAIQTGHSKLLRCVLDLVSMLSVESPFISGKAKEFLASCENMMTKVKPFSDLFVYLYLFQSFSGMSSRSDQRALIAKYFLHEKSLKEAIRLRSQLKTIISRSFVQVELLDLEGEKMAPVISFEDLNNISSQLVSLFVLAHPDCIAKRLSSPGKTPLFLPVGLSTDSTIRSTSPISTWISPLTQVNEKNESQTCKAKPDTSSIFSTYSLRTKRLGGWFVYGRIRQHLDRDGIMMTMMMDTGKISLSVISEIPDPTLISEHVLKLLSSSKLN